MSQQCKYELVEALQGYYLLEGRAFLLFETNYYY